MGSGDAQVDLEQRRIYFPPAQSHQISRLLRRPASKVMDGLSIVERLVTSKCGTARGVAPYIAREAAAIFGVS